jgi:hypothetical protein
MSTASTSNETSRSNSGDMSMVNRPVPAACGNNEFLDGTIEVWQAYSHRVLTREDAREIVHNVMGFVQVLREWAEGERREERRS